MVGNDEQAIAIMQQARFDPTEKLVRLSAADTPPGLIRNGYPSDKDKATFLLYEPERVMIETHLESPGWLLLTDTYYPGWQATVNGQPVDIFQANVLFRAVPVPAGDHLVEFEFRPRSLQWGAAITGLAVLLTIAGLVVAGTRQKVESD